MAVGAEEMQELEALEARLNAMLPAVYQDRDDEVLPVSMGSAGLKYGADGQVAWDEIWESFCDLAMAGGPPHRGTLLRPSSTMRVSAEPGRYRQVLQELCRGIAMVTGLHAEPSPEAGWVRLYCTSAAMAGWLARAILMENVSARFKGLALYLPAGPHFRVEKEIKNVITAIAKTCHYWLQHMSEVQHQQVAALLRSLEATSPLIEPGPCTEETDLQPFRRIAEALAAGLRGAAQTTAVPDACSGWLGVVCENAGDAIWKMRALVACNVLARREGTFVFLPIHPMLDPEGKRIVRIYLQVHRCALTRAVLKVPPSAAPERL